MNIFLQINVRTYIFDNSQSSYNIIWYNGTCERGERLGNTPLGIKCDERKIKNKIK